MPRVILLGTGNPTPRVGRCGSATLVRVREEALLFDCGPGATHRLAAAGVSLSPIAHLFFTHHHFDHNADYGFFVLARWDQGAGKAPPLRVFGPKPTERITRLLFGEGGAYADDIRARTLHPLSQRVYMNRGGEMPRRPPALEARDVGPGEVWGAEDWRVSAAEAIHAQPYLESLAYRVDSAEGSVVISGDTRPHPNVVELARGADVLIHMCMNPEEDLERYPEFRDSCAGPKGSAAVAREAGVKKLVLVHLGEALDHPAAAQRAVEEARSVFPGEVVEGKDLLEL